MFYFMTSARVYLCDHFEIIHQAIICSLFCMHVILNLKKIKETQLHCFLKIKNWIGIKILTSATLYLKRCCNYAFKILRGEKTTGG